MKYIVNPTAAVKSSLKIDGQIVYFDQGEEYPVEKSGYRPDEIQVLVDMGQLVAVPDASERKTKGE